MPKSITCMCNGKEISVEEAIDIKVNKPTVKGMFTCISCGEPVKPFRASITFAAHFEHFVYNEQNPCPLGQK